MPAVDHLQWFDIDDFSAGLWDEVGATAQLLAPPKAFSVLQDYEPRPGGGVRAFYAGTSLGVTGLDSATTERIMGIFTTTKAGSSSTDDDRYMVTIDTSDFKVRGYRWALPDGATQWSKKYTSIAGSNATFVFASFVGFVNSSGTKYVLFCTRSVAEQGVHRWTDADSVTLLQSSAIGPLTVAQARVIMCEGGNIHYSDSGVETFTSFTNQVIKPSQEKTDASIAMLAEVAPADLLIATQHAPWYLMSGDILSPTVRLMGDDHHARGNHVQDMIRVPQGIAFIEPGGCIYVTDGHTFQNLSQPIRRFAVDYGPSDGTAFGVGRLAYQNDYLFAPGGYVFDFRTKAWFKTSAVAHAYGWASTGGKVYLATSSSTPAIYTITPYENTAQQSDESNRCTSGIIQTVPYADANGRNIDVKEVQVFAYSYAATEFKCELIDETGSSVVTRYAVAPTAGRDMLKFQFPATKSDYISVKLTVTSVGSHEAATIERLRIGFGVNNLIRGG